MHRDASSPHLAGASAPALSAPATLARSGRHILLGYALLAPAALLVLGLLIYPVLYGLALSLTNASSDGPGAFVGLRNFARMAGLRDFWAATLDTVALVGVTTAVELVVGVLTALLLWWRFWGRSVVFLAVFVPWAFPASFSAFAWYWLLMPPFHSFYTLQVLDARWWLEGIFGMGAWQVLSIGIMNVWRGSSIIGIFVLAGLNAIPEELLEFGKLEARNPWQYFWRVVVPLARRFLVLAGLVALVITYTEYVSLYLETGGRITVPVLGTLAYRELIQVGDTGLGAALAFIQVPFAAALALLCLRVAGERRRRHGPVPSEDARWRPPRSRSLAPAPRPPVRPAAADPLPPRSARRRVRRRLASAAGVAAALALMVFHVFPVYYTGVQALRSVDEYAYGNPFWVYAPDFGDVLEVIQDPVIWRWGWNTLVIFGGVLVVGLSASLLAGYALARFRLPGATWIARLMFCCYFIPQVAVVIPAYQILLLWNLDDTVLGIALLYLTLAIPFATWLFAMYFEGLDPDVEDHARLDGSRAQVFLKIVLPMSWPVIIAAGLFAIGMMGSDVLYAGTFSLTNATKTLPAGLGLIAVELDEWAPVNAAILLSSLPIIVACAALSPYYVRGLRAALIEGA